MERFLSHGIRDVPSRLVLMNGLFGFDAIYDEDDELGKDEEAGLGLYEVCGLRWYEVHGLGSAEPPTISNLSVTGGLQP